MPKTSWMAKKRRKWSFDLRKGRTRLLWPRGFWRAGLVWCCEEGFGVSEMGVGRYGLRRFSRSGAERVRPPEATSRRYRRVSSSLNGGIVRVADAQTQDKVD